MCVCVSQFLLVFCFVFFVEVVIISAIFGAVFCSAIGFVVVVDGDSSGGSGSKNCRLNPCTNAYRDASSARLTILLHVN